MLIKSFWGYVNDWGFEKRVIDEVEIIYILKICGVFEIYICFYEWYVLVEGVNFF